MTPSDSAAAGRDSLAAAGDSARAVADSVAAHLRDSLATVPRRDYLAEVRAGFTSENRAYAHTRVVLELVEPMLVVLMLAVVLFSGFSARLRDVARTLGHRRYVQVLVYFSLLTLLTTALWLPLAWYRGFALEHQYGLSNQTFLDWFTDQLKDVGFTIGFFGVIPVIALAYGTLQRHPRTWWLWLAGGSIPLLALSILLTPLIYDTAFNKFTPLEDPVLRQEILDLAARADIPARNVYQSDKSAQTNKINAYVSGFGASQRIVLWDTTLKRMKRDEILFVMGHEMGHYTLGHIWKTIAFVSGLGFVAFFLAGRIVVWAIRRFGETWDIAEVHDVATMPLFGIVFTVLSALAQPGVAAFSRTIEHESDVYALEITHDNDAGARAFLALAEQNRSDPEPSPFVRAVLYDHPPLAERIRFALTYRPWAEGRPNRFYQGPGPAD